MLKISVISPLKNEAQYLGYSIMAVLPYVHELIYSCADSTDGTDDLLAHIQEKYAKDKLKILRKPEYDWNTGDMRAYNASYNDCIKEATGDAVFFLHPDMIVTNPESIASVERGPFAWWTNLTSYAGDLKTVITKGRATRWKNIHAKRLGLHYYGAYGSQNEDFYHRDITGSSYVHHGENFKAYPFAVGDSGINVNHYCETKDYTRRFEKMKSCLRNIYPKMEEKAISEMAANHPRVTLDGAVTDIFGTFEFKKTDVPPPPVFAQYQEEFQNVLGGRVLA